MTKQRLVINEKVELRSLEDGFLGSWHSGTVISLEKGIRKVQYDHLLSNNNDNLVEYVNVNNVLDGYDCLWVVDCCYRGLIRPLLTLVDFDMWGVKYGQCVDVYYRDAWWEGVVFDRSDGVRERSVFFPDIGDELVADVGSMRVSQDWDESSGDWKVRGKWLLLELIDEFEKEGWPVVVSIKQIWYDVRVKKGFVENFMEWTCLRSDAWRGLLEEVLVDNLKLTMKELYRELEFLGVKGFKGCCKILELNGSEFHDLIKSKPFDEIGREEVVSVVESDSDRLDVVPISTSVQGEAQYASPLKVANEPFDEIGREEVVSVVESDSDRLDVVPISSSVQGEAQCASPLKVANVDSSTHEELYKEGRCAEYGDSCNGSQKVLKKSKHNIWIFAEIAPKYSDDAIEIYLNCQLSKDTPQIPHEVTLNLRKHLLFLGWKVEYLQKEGFRRWRYTHPDGNEKCYSLVKVCEQILSDSAKVSRFPVDEQNRLPDDSDRLDVVPISSSVQGEAQCASPLKVANVDSSTHEELYKEGRCAEYGDSCNGSRKLLKKSKQNIWIFAEYAPEYSDDAIEVYLNCQLSKNTPQIPHEVTVNLRRHLLFLGWKVEYLQKEGYQRWRYTHPDGNEKCYSLVKVCEQILSDSAKVSRFPVDEQNRLPDAAADAMVLTPLVEKFQGCKSELVKNSPDMLEFEYCPQAVIDYYSLEIKETVHPKDHEKHKGMQLKAKNHLSAVGWKLYTAYRNNKKESRYRSPWGKLYFSLRSACKGYLDENRNVLKQADALLAGEGRCSAIETGEFHGNPKKKRKSNARHPASCPRFLKSRKKESNSMQVHRRDTLRNYTSDHVSVSRKSAREVVLPFSDHKNPRTVLSMLVEKHMVSVEAEVQYRRDGVRMAEGIVTCDGIWCKCCQKIFSVSNFEIHAIGMCSQPSANLFFCKDEKSLQQRQIDYLIDTEVTSKPKHQNYEEEDDVCSVCRSYGTLILCDKCPSAFHSHCLGLKQHPDCAIWFCPSCCCKICGGAENSGQIEVSTNDSVISCDQCERRYHFSCLRMNDVVSHSYPKGYRFCNKKCEQISFELQKRLGKSVQVGANGLTWTLLKYVNPEESDQDSSDIANLAENYSKLNVAVGVMHECFEPLEEPRTRSDLVEDVIFSRWSKLNRLNFRGFYTVLLEKNDELISAATVRIYGEKVAEIPLVATRFLYRRQGMCRILLNELEKVLRELGVEKLVLPAVPSLLNTWTSSFGFSVMSQSDRLEHLDYTFLNFQGTTMCQKLL